MRERAGRGGRHNGRDARPAPIKVPLRRRRPLPLPGGAGAMSGFSPELIDYLEGKISFEEFERRREERKSREKVSLPRLTARSGPLPAASLRDSTWQGRGRFRSSVASSLLCVREVLLCSAVDGVYVVVNFCAKTMRNCL